MYADKFKIEPAKLMKRLWGDQFYNASLRKWNKTGGEGYVRGFCQFILDPIYKVSSIVGHKGQHGWLIINPCVLVRCLMQL